MRSYRDLTLDQLVDIWRQSELERVLNSPTIVFHNAYTPSVTHYRWYADGTEAGSSVLEDEDTAHTLVLTGSDATVHLRMLLRESGGDTGQANNTTIQLRYSKNAGGATNVTAASTNVQAAGTGSGLTDDGATTNRATGLTDPTGTFIAGVQEEGDGSFLTATEVSPGDFTEYVFAINIVDADVANGDSFTFDFTESGAAPTFDVTPTLTISKTIPVNPGSGSITLTGYDPTVTTVSAGLISPLSGSITLTGYAPTSSKGFYSYPASGSVSLAGAAPTVTVQVNSAPGAGAVTLTAYPPSLSIGYSSSPSAGSITLTGYAPVYLGRLTPLTDSSIGSWTDENAGTTDIFQSIDENTANDADYVISEASPSASKATFSLPPVLDPGSDENHVVRYRYRKEGSETVDLTVSLLQGAAVIKSVVHSGISTTIVEGAMALSAGEASAITDYATLRLEFEANVP